MPEVDYKRLLGKYMSVVLEEEGYDYISPRQFSEEEMNLLNEAYNEYEE